MISQELLTAAKEALEKLAPPGSKFSIDGIPAYWFLNLSCDGAYQELGYHCALNPGHAGKCYSLTKNTHFKRRN